LVFKSLSQYAFGAAARTKVMHNRKHNHKNSRRFIAKEIKQIELELLHFVTNFVTSSS